MLIGIANINWNKHQQVSEGALTTLANLTMQIPFISGGTVSDKPCSSNSLIISND